jgi:hypothetical protein
VSSILAFWLAAGPVNAEAADVQQAQRMYSAFSCSVYAGWMNDLEEQDRLFNVGYEAGHRFIAAVESGSVTDDDLFTKVPQGVSRSVFGPTTEFILGRMFQSAAMNALSSVDIGMARMEYINKNCAIIE